MYHFIWLFFFYLYLFTVLLNTFACVLHLPNTISKDWASLNVLRDAIWIGLFSIHRTTQVGWGICGHSQPRQQQGVKPFFESYEKWWLPNSTVKVHFLEESFMCCILFSQLTHPHCIGATIFLLIIYVCLISSSCSSIAEVTAYRTFTFLFSFNS